MENPPSENSRIDDGHDQHVDERFIYVVPGDRHGADIIDDIDFYEVWNVVWRGKNIIFATAVVIALLAAVYSLLVTPIYRSEVLLAPVEEGSDAAGLMGQLGGLAGLAGLGIGGERKKIDALAVLHSRNFTREFIQDYNLLPILFADQWDEEGEVWKGSDPDDWPDMRDAVEFFGKSVRTVRQDGKTDLVLLSIDWSDPVLAATWANALAQRLNSTMRDKAIKRATVNIKFLQKEIEVTRVVALQQAISRLLEGELQTLMLARGNDEFVFRIIDMAEEPKRRIWPARSLIVALAFVGGGLFSMIFVLIRHTALRRQLIEEQRLVGE